jgi:cytochrome b subunit of formate dehydrogenase
MNNDNHEKRDKGLFEDLGPEDLGCMDLGDHTQVTWVMEMVQMILVIIAITGIVLWII